MARCLLALVVAAGLVALASATRGTRLPAEGSKPMDGNRLRETEIVNLAGTPRTLLRIAPAFGLEFSLN
jgi:hypothetical protein